MTVRFSDSVRAVFATGVSVALAFVLAMTGAPLFGGTGRAWADEAGEVEDAQQVVDQAQITLDSAEKHMDAVLSEYDTLKQQVDQLQDRIDEGAARAVEAQQAVIAGRADLGQTVAYQYRDGGSVQSFVALVLGSSDFSELLQSLFYLDRVMEYQSDQVAAQKERASRFEELVDTLNTQKNEQDAKLAQLEAKKAEAEQVAANASSQLQNAQSDQASRLAALQQKADELAAQGAVSEPVEVEEADTPDRQPVVSDDAAVEPDPAPSQPGGSGSGGEGGSGSGGDGSSDSSGGGVGWSTGVASAYGGSTDPYTPNPGITATGAVCDDFSMGVAVPMAWSNYWQYYGRTVEISYGGMTVFATVNDCGGMGGGSRSLDLQPGVWKAFGFSSCTDWGLRTVSYRFL